MKPVESVSLKTSVASQQRDRNNSLHTERAPQVAVSLPLSFRADCGLAMLPGRAGYCWTLTAVGWRRDILIRLFLSTLPCLLKWNLCRAELLCVRRFLYMFCKCGKALKCQTFGVNILMHGGVLTHSAEAVWNDYSCSQRLNLNWCWNKACGIICQKGGMCEEGRWDTAK